MNGIYDFDSYRTPYLDVEMLMERKAKKREKQMLVLAGILAVLMIIVSVLLLCNIALINQELLTIAYIGVAIYLIAGVVVFGALIRKMKGEYLWQAL